MIRKQGKIIIMNKTDRRFFSCAQLIKRQKRKNFLHRIVPADEKEKKRLLYAKSIVAINLNIKTKSKFMIRRSCCVSGDIKSELFYDLLQHGLSYNWFVRPVVRKTPEILAKTWQNYSFPRHLPYSSHIALFDYWLFRWIQHDFVLIIHCSSAKCYAATSETNLRKLLKKYYPEGEPTNCKVRKKTNKRNEIKWQLWGITKRISGNQCSEGTSNRNNSWNPSIWHDQLTWEGNCEKITEYLVKERKERDLSPWVAARICLNLLPPAVPRQQI